MDLISSMEGFCGGFIGNLLLHAGTIRFPSLPLNCRPIYVSMGYPFLGNKLKIVSNEGFANTSSPEKGIYKFKKTGQENETNAKGKEVVVSQWVVDGWMIEDISVNRFQSFESLLFQSHGYYPLYSFSSTEHIPRP